MKRVLESETRTRSAHEVWLVEAVGFFVGFFGLVKTGRRREGSVDGEEGCIGGLRWAIVW